MSCLGRVVLDLKAYKVYSDIDLYKNTWSGPENHKFRFANSVSTVASAMYHTIKNL